MTTGDMPPNSKGAAFVFDPKVKHLHDACIFCSVCSESNSDLEAF